MLSNGILSRLLLISGKYGLAFICTCYVAVKLYQFIVFLPGISTLEYFNFPVILFNEECELRVEMLQ